MGLFDFLKKKRPVMNEPEKPVKIRRVQEVDYHGLAELTAILTNGSRQAQADMAGLAEDYRGFMEKYPEWCGEFLDGVEGKAEIILNAVAYWLAGEGREDKFGGYIDWKEAPEDIVWHLEAAAKKLGYPIDFTGLEFGEKEYTQGALQRIGRHLEEQGYSLLYLDTGGDCYHLFICRTEQYPGLLLLAEQMDFIFRDLY